MGDVSIIARRLKDGHVQHGWSGNGGYFCMVGARLLKWYTEPEKVEYLFDLGQTKLIGAPGSENGGYSFMKTHACIGSPYYLGTCEDDIFSKIAFIDYAYFYDVDNKWYYISPYGFNIKMPLELIANNLDDRGDEFEFLKQIDRDILTHIFQDYVRKDEKFKLYVESKGYELNQVYESCKDKDYPTYHFVDKY